MNRRVLIFPSALAVLAIAACNDSNEMQPPDVVACEATILSFLQSGTTLLATGQFDGGQPIISLGQTITLPATDYTSTSATFDLTGVPPGTYTVKLDVSCDEHTAKGPIDGSKVPSVTIH
jgi:hypothetical protein